MGDILPGVRNYFPGRGRGGRLAGARCRVSPVRLSSTPAT